MRKKEEELKQKADLDNKVKEEMRQIELDKQERELRTRMAEREKLIKEREIELKRLEAEQA